MLADLLHRAARPPVAARGRVPPGFMPFGSWARSELGPEWETGQWVTDDDALGLPVISGFLDIAVGLCVQMPLHAWVDGYRSTADPPILRNPAPGPGRTLADWITELIRTLALRGNYVAVLGNDSWTGWPDVLYPVPTGQWSVDTDPSGRVRYQIAGLTYDATDVFHVRRGVENCELVGRGLLDNYRQLIASAVAAERWAARYFSTGAVPPAHVEHSDPDLTIEQAAEVKALWNRVVRLREAFITPAGTKVTPLSSDAEKAQLADTRRANDAKLAIACGIPGALLGLEGPSLTYRNIVDVFQQFLTVTMMGYIEPVEQALSLFCLPRGTEAKFETSAVLRPDLAARVDIAVKATAADLMTRDEGRSLIDLPPDPDSNTDSNTPAGEPVTVPALEAVS